MRVASNVATALFATAIGLLVFMVTITRTPIPDWTRDAILLASLSILLFATCERRRDRP